MPAIGVVLQLLLSCSSSRWSLPLVQSPELDRAVLSSRGAPTPAGIKRYRIDVMGVPFQGPHLPPCLYIPDLDGFIPTARSRPGESVEILASPSEPVEAVNRSSTKICAPAASPQSQALVGRPLCRDFR